jgi:hypothetical protein
MEFDLKDNQTAAKLFYDDDEVTIEEMQRFAKAINARQQQRHIIGTDMWELFVLQSAMRRLKSEIERKIYEGE